MPTIRTSRSALLWCLFLVTAQVVGQRPSRSGIGLKAGPQLSTTHVEGVPYDPAPGAQAGFYFPIWSGNRFELQPELLLAYQGSTIDRGESGTSAFRSYHVQLPFTAKLYVSNVFNISAGVQIGRLLKMEARHDDAVTDITDDYRPFEAGTLFGIGADFISGLDLSLRRYTGLTSLTADTDLNPTYRCWQLTVGYRLWRFYRGVTRHRS